MTKIGPGGWIALLLAYGLCAGCDTTVPPSRSNSTSDPALSSVPTKRRVERSVSDPSSAATQPGLVSAVGNRVGIALCWTAPTFPARAYRIYVSEECGRHRFDAPYAEVSGASTRHFLTGLEVGRTYYTIVRSVDEAGREDSNERELGAVVAEVRFVDQSAPPGGDGLTPETPFTTISDAIGSAVSVEQVNVYVAAGDYRERVFLFDGMSLYGGFDRSFGFETRSPNERPTVLYSSDDGDLISVAPGPRLCAIGGWQLEGAEKGRRGVAGSDCNIQLTWIEIREFRDKGIELRAGDEVDDCVTGVVQNCDVSHNLGEGIRLSGTLDLVLRDVRVHENRQEGLEVEPLTFSHREKGKLEIDRCEFSDNLDLGLEISARPHPKATGGKLRVNLRHVVCTGNADDGASIDIDGTANPAFELRVDVWNCSFSNNGKHGLSVDADLDFAFRIARSTINENRGSGVLLRGDATRFFCRLQNSTLLGNHAAGLTVDSPAFVSALLSVIDGIKCRRGSVDRTQSEVRDLATTNSREPTPAVLTADPDKQPRIAPSSYAAAVDGVSFGVQDGFFAHRFEAPRCQDLHCVTPLPGNSHEGRWRLEFRYPVETDVTVVVRANDRVLPSTVRRDGVRLDVVCEQAIDADASVVLELGPTSLDLRRPLPWRYRLIYPAKGG